MARIEETVNSNGIRASGYWIKQLKTLPQHQVGVVKASGKLLDGIPLEQLVGEMSYLANAGWEHDNGSGLYLPLVIGGGVHYDKLQSYTNGRKVGGLRVTSKELIEEMVPIALQNQQKTTDALVSKGAEAAAIPFNVVFVVPHGTEKDGDEEIDMGYVGDIISIDTKPIIRAIFQKQIPVLSHIGVYDGGFYNINATTVATELVKRLQAKKLIIVGDTPVYDKDGNLIKTVYSDKHFEALVKDGTIMGGMIVNVSNSYDLLKRLGPGHSVQITALNGNSVGLLEELLGDGSGTMLIMPHVVTSYPLEAVDTKLLEARINKSFAQFGKQLLPRYFDEIKSKNPAVYMDSMEKGVAITYKIHWEFGKAYPSSWRQEMFPFEYICKIATDSDYEGIGIASSILDTIMLQKKSVAWRASATNQDAIARYKRYAERNNGFVAEGNDYFVFGVGIPNEKHASVVRVVNSIAPTLRYD